MVIRKLNGKEPVDGLLDLDASDLITDATTTAKGIVQVGSGLDVDNGVISSSIKHYLRATSNTGVFSGGDTTYSRIYPSDNLITNGIEYDTSNGLFTLEVGKVYKIEYVASFDSTNTMTVSLYYENGTEVSSHNAVFGNRNNLVGSGYYTDIIIPEQDKNSFFLKLVTISGNMTLIANTAILTIIEL